MNVTRLYHFDETFERDAVWLMLTDPAFMRKVGQHVDPAKLRDPLHKYLATFAGTVYKAAGTVSASAVMQHVASLVESGKLRLLTLDTGNPADIGQDSYRAWVDEQSARPAPAADAIEIVLRDKVASMLWHEAKLEIFGKEISQSKSARAKMDLAEKLASGKLGDTAHAFYTPSLELADADPVSWIWRGRLARGELHLVAGSGGVGKSTAIRDIAARLMMGDAMPCEDDKVESAPVILMCPEDDDRLVMSGLVDAGLTSTERLTMRAGTMQLPADIPELEARIRATGAALVIIERHHVRGNADKADDVRAALDPLAECARSTGAAIVVVRHRNKREGSARVSLTGSHAWNDTARHVLFVAKDSNDPGLRILTVGKSNLPGGNAPAIGIRQIPDMSADGSARARYRLEWEPCEDVSADDLFAAESDKSRGKAPRAATRDAFEAAVDTVLRTGEKTKAEIAAALPPDLANPYKLDRLLPKIASRSYRERVCYWRRSDLPRGMTIADDAGQLAA